uniref:Uncharacterized protein n=1 Tax=Oryzias latipes TaxID=8090 RepID=A0A3P9I7K7_ORYLA
MLASSDHFQYIFNELGVEGGGQWRGPVAGADRGADATGFLPSVQMFVKVEAGFGPWTKKERRATARGENVVLLRETDLDQVSIEEILKEQRLQQQAKRETEKVKMQALKDADHLDEY